MMHIHKSWIGEHWTDQNQWLYTGSPTKGNNTTWEARTGCGTYQTVLIVRHMAWTQCAPCWMGPKKISMKQKAFTVDREYEKVSQLFFFSLT